METWQLPPFFVKDVRHALEEEHAEDVFLVFGRVHGAAQDVGGFHQEGFELGEGDALLHYACSGADGG